MSQYQAFRRVAVPPQVAQQQQTTTLPAPSRGIVLDENQAFQQPGAANVCDNWMPTLRGVALRGGCIRHCELPETTPVISAFRYDDGTNEKMFAANSHALYEVTTTSPDVVVSGHNSGNYCASQLSNQGGDFMLAVNDYGDPVLRFDGATWTVLNHTPASAWANSHAYSVGDRANDTADGSNWKCMVAHTSAATGTTFLADRNANPTFWMPDVAADGMPWITGPAGSNVVNGSNLTYVCKFHNRYFFIEASSMNAWYLPVNAVGGYLGMIPLSGAASKGGKLLFCTVWSVDAGDGLDDKLIFMTTLGEVLVFSGSDPASATNWRQEGRYTMAAPMGMNAYMGLGGDVLIMTTQGIMPVSACINKTPEEMELAAISKVIKPMWRDEADAKRNWSWTMINWEKFGGLFITWPGSTPGYCAAVNAATGAWCRFVGYDATCWIMMRDDMYFGTQGGIIMQADRGGMDDGKPYLASLVGGWEVFQSPAQTITWRQARASFVSSAGQPFKPQLSACTDYVVTLPPAPAAGPDPGPVDAWDEADWGPDMGGPPPPVPTPPERVEYGQWDQAVTRRPTVRNTMWISIGKTGFSHAPVVQVTVSQQVKPNVELICINATFERAGITV